ncbi:FIST signal transduction protein [Reinekea sp.]|jgi:hypothetical protein|uniref:FIST signal transduction protein n=1 Tax=Reinekea sp. TaxID=1970455 RepID=UPI002A81B748|nr:FIST N-terminal domain-containing protein [Reinekea sp.]
MRSNQFHYQAGAWHPALPENSKAQWVLVFGSRRAMQGGAVNVALAAAFPRGHRMGSTTSGEILGARVFDESLVVTAVEFDHSRIASHSVDLADHLNLEAAAEALVAHLPVPGLRHVMVFCDGQQVNGTTLVSSLVQHLPANVLLTGGMAGDDDRFTETVVWHNDRVAAGKIVICGFYGAALEIGHGSLGGWDSFGADRLITKAEGNVLYELDDKPALELYKRYLGKLADDLPGAALRFPLSVRLPGATESTVRTILSIDEGKQTMIFAGDMPVGAFARLMHANAERLIDGAQDAAKHALTGLSGSPQLALLISCIGRRLVLKQETEAELEAIQELMADDCQLCGFYSYGEISPLLESRVCTLHNQTMTITTFSEPS